jgi:hypothetical protein
MGGRSSAANRGPPSCISRLTQTIPADVSLMLTSACEDYGMSNSSTRRLTNLLLATSSSGMSLASSSLYLAIPSLPNHPIAVGRYFRQMRSELDELEAGTCALMRYSGVSWDVLATYYGVSRQALYRRMASRADRLMEEAQDSPEIYGYTFDTELQSALGMIGGLKSSFDEDLSNATQIWQARQKKTAWWREGDRT